MTTTFTSSQGLLLMIPNMYKIAGELTAAVIHVAARSLATQALSIFCDHSDVMSTRATGFAMLASNSVQEAMDFALIAHAATMEARVPFLHFFDGFRTSHEVMKVVPMGVEEIRDDRLQRHPCVIAIAGYRPIVPSCAGRRRTRMFTSRPANRSILITLPVLRSCKRRWTVLPGSRDAPITCSTSGASDAERVVVMIGSVRAAEEAVEALVARGEKVGLVKCRLYRPFAVEQFLAHCRPA